MHVVEQPHRFWRRRLASLPRCTGFRPHEGASAVCAGAVQESSCRLAVAHHGRAEAPVEGRGHGELVAGIDLQLVGQDARSAGMGGLTPQELVDGGKLSPDARRGPPRVLDGALGGAELGDRALGLLLGLASRPRGLLHDTSLRAYAIAGHSELGLELRELARQARLAAAVQNGQRSLKRGNPRLRLRIFEGARFLLRERSQLLAVAPQTVLDRGGRRLHGVGAVGHTLEDGPSREVPAGELLALAAPARQRLLGGLTPAGDPVELSLEALTFGARLSRLGLGDRERALLAAQIVARQLPACLQ